MRNPLRRLISRDRAPPSRADMAVALRRNVDPIGPPSDDYLVEGEQLSDQPTTAAQIIQVLQVLVIVALAVLSLAVFWLLGVLFNIF